MSTAQLLFFNQNYTMKPEKIVSINTDKDPSAAIDRIMNGVDLLANAVKSTLGPYGRNFLLEKSGGRITNDGITIAREIQSKDEIEDLAIRIAREAAIKTNELAGDGTTTATTLMQAIMRKCVHLLPREGQFSRRSVLSIRKQIEEESEEITQKLIAMSLPVETEDQLIEVAKVSVEDEDLAKLIAKAQWELGPDGYIVAEETPEPVCSIEKINGIRIDNGLGTSMVMNDAEKQRLVVEDSVVLLTNYVINNLAPLANVLQRLVNSGKPNIVIVARAWSSEAIKTVMENHSRGVMIYPFNAPYVNQREVFEDLQAVLGGRYIHDEAASLDSVNVSDFGHARKIIGERYSAIFTGDREVTDRVAKLKEELKGEPSKFMQKALQQRIAQLKNGFALLKIGSTSDTDRKYKFDKAEDAVNAVRSALQEGTVPGAGLAMKQIAEEMPDDALLKQPLMAPWQQIMDNAGEEFEIEPWVRNSVKVERVALANACRIAADLITAGGAIATERIKPIDQMLRNTSSN